MIILLQKKYQKFADSDFCTTFAFAISNGALVQLVRIRACHARGQGFESPTHRKEATENSVAFFVFIKLIPSFNNSPKEVFTILSQTNSKNLSDLSYFNSTIIKKNNLGVNNTIKFPLNKSNFTFSPIIHTKKTLKLFLFLTNSC